MASPKARSKVVFFCMALGQLLSLTGLAQLTKLTDRDSFSEAAIPIGFGEMARDGIQANEAFTGMGVRFFGEDGSTPQFEVIVTVPIAPPLTDVVLRNVPLGESSAGSSLIIRFDRPMKRIGLGLGNGDETTTAEIRAYTLAGELLGVVEQEAGLSDVEGVFVGVETDYPEGISTVVLSYGDAEQAEQVDGLIFDYLDEVLFTSCVAQAAHGPINGSFSLQTVIRVQNVFANSVAGELRTFNNNSNEPLQLESKGEISDSFQLELEARASRTFSTTGSDEVISGYACVESSRPVLIHTSYRLSGPHGPLSEAGLAATEAKPYHIIPVEREVASGRDTAVAIANITEKEIFVTFHARDETGETLPEPGALPFIQLGPGEHRALFLTEIHPSLAESDFEGSLGMFSGDIFVVTSLQTVNGIVVASLPAGSTQK